MSHAHCKFRLVGALLALLPVISSCVPKALPNLMGKEDWGAQVTWHGHSCFSLRDSTGRTIVIDPFDDTVGYGRLRVRADVLMVTHNHFDHNEKRAVRARLRDLELAESTGTVTVAAGLPVLGISSDHDNVGGQINGPNRIFVFNLGGVKFVHMGDFGQEDLKPSQKAMIGQVDVLMIPVGGFTTLNPVQAKRIVDELKPRAVIPMHYGNIRFYPLAPVEQFTRLFPSENVAEAAGTMRFRKSDLEGMRTTVFVFTPANRDF